MWLGGHGTAATEAEWQSVTIPAAAFAPNLSYWIRTDTAETGSTAYDTLKVQVISASTTSTLATHSNVGASLRYSRVILDLSAYKGQTISIKFLMKEDSARQTSFVVDDTAITMSSPKVPTLFFPALDSTFSPLDFTGDARSDVMRVTPTGDLYLYRGNGSGGITGGGTKIGAGWGFVKVFSPGDFTGDGKSDIIGITSSGDMYLFHGNGVGGFSGSGSRIGAGWGMFDKVFSSGDFTGDGRSDILAVKPNGDLYLYRGNGLGGFAGGGSRIGAGWGIFGKVFSAGDFNGDGRPDIFALKPNGDLYLYRGNGLGGFAGGGSRIGAGWGIFVTVFSPGDFTGDGRSDILAVSGNGDLFLYRGNGMGGFTGPGTKIAPA
jgi:hypothetical protein